MILLHRITPFAILGLVFAGFSILIGNNPSLRGVAVVLFALVPLLFARLTLFELRRPAFWVFVGTPSLLLLSSILFFLFQESANAEWILAAVVTLMTYLYAENLFAFYHFPRSYQAYALEHLSLVLDIMSAFFFTSAAYAAQLFLRFPAWIPALAVFVAVLLATVSVFWVSKIGFETGFVFAIAGAVLFSECYLVLSFLPTSYVTNAAAFAVLLYFYLDVARTHVLSKITATYVKRRIVLSLLFLGAIYGSARWL